MKRTAQYSTPTGFETATTSAHAVPRAGFKNCCMLTGEFDGSDRDQFFQGMI